MQLRGLLIGLGLGIILSSVIFYFGYSVELKKAALAVAEAQELSDALVIARAKELGMISKEESQKATEEISTEKIIKEASAIGMLFPGEANKEAEPIPESTPEALPEPTNIEEPALQEPSSIPDVSAEPLPQISLEPLPSFEVKVIDPGKLVEVEIKEGTNALEISQMLQQVGVIDDYEAFRRYAVAQNATKRLGKGIFTLPLSGDYETVLKILSRNNIQ